MTTERHEEIVETVANTAPRRTVEERVIDDDGTVRRVVRTVGESISAPPQPSPIAMELPTPPRMVRRFWRRTTTVPLDASDVGYTTTGAYASDAALGQIVRVSWFLVGLLEGILAVRFTLALFGANAENAFAALVYGLSWPFVAPFRTLFGVPTAAGSVFETYTLTAMLVIFVGWWVAIRLVEVLTNRSVEG